MRQSSISLLVFSMLMLSCFEAPVHADDAKATEPKKLSVEEQLAKFVELGPGVHAIKKSKKGRIISCVVVGQARISTALGKAKGLEIARSKADLTCSAEFVKWLKEEVSVHEVVEEESVILLEGKEGADEDSLSESGKAIEKTGKRMESVSKGLVRGMQLLHKEVDGNGTTFTLVKGWKADNVDGVKKITADLATDKPGSESQKGKSKSEKPAKKKKIDKEIESGSATSEDAKDFLP